MNPTTTDLTPTGFRIFIIGESSGDPADWSDWGARTLVVARSAEEARTMAEHSSAVAEVCLDKPGVLLTTEGMGFDNLWEPRLHHQPEHAGRRVVPCAARSTVLKVITNAKVNRVSALELAN